MDGFFYSSRRTYQIWSYDVSHPNTFAQGYRARANGHDYQFLLDVGVSGMIRSQEGYEYIPIPGER
jgi:hypothetical protein